MKITITKIQIKIIHKITKIYIKTNKITKKITKLVIT